jgi:hypothetical protein
MATTNPVTTPEPYITSDMRPLLVPKLGLYPPHEPGAPIEDLKKLSLEILEMTEEQWLEENPQYQKAQPWHDRFGRSPSVTASVLDDETVLLNVETCKYYTLNKWGSAVWQFFNGGCTMAEVLDKVCSAFDVHPTQAEGDLIVFVGKLRREKLICSEG